MSETTKELIHGKIIAVMQEVDPILKKHRNQQQNYNFRGIDDVFNEVHPLFMKNGVYITQRLIESKREDRKTNSGSTLIYSLLRIVFQFRAEDGSFVECEMASEGMDSGDKATAKANSAALKYAILQMLLIPTSDLKDPEAGDSGNQPGDGDALPGSKQARKQARPTEGKGEAKPGQWRTFEWTANFGANRDKSMTYKGKTLGEIHDANPEGLAYWIQNFVPKEFKGKISDKDIALRAALDQAKEELAKNEAAGGTAADAANESQAAPIEPPKTIPGMVAEIEGLCKAKAIPMEFMITTMHEKKLISPETSLLIDVPEKVLGQVIQHFDWFVARYEKAKGAA